MPSILDRKFKYTPACATDISKTFARIKREAKKPQTVVKVPAIEVDMTPIDVRTAAQLLRRVK